MTDDPAARFGRRVVVLAAIVVAAALLRVVGLRFGEGVPAARPDESIAMGVLSVMPSVTLPTNLFLYGGGYFYPLYGFVRLATALGGAGGLADAIARDPFTVLLAARAWSAILATLTVALVYAIGRHVAGVRAGIVAATLLATCALAAREAHFAKPDTAATFAAALLLFTIARPWTSVGQRALAVGAAAGLTASTKGCFGFLPAALLALWLVPGNSAGRTRSVVTGVGALAVVFVILNAFCVLQPVAFAKSLVAMRGLVDARRWTGGDATGGPLRYHAVVSLRYGCGVAFALLTLPALAFGLWRGGGLRLVSTAVLGHWATLLTGDVAVARYLLPSLPALAVLVAATIVAATERATRPGLARLAATVGVSAAIVAEPLANAVTIDALLRRPDTRALAAAWIEANVPSGAALASFGARSIWTDYGRPPTGTRPAFTRLPPAQWSARGVRWVVASSYPMPYADQPLPPDTPGVQRVALFDPFDGPLDDPILEPMDAFFLPLAHFAGITRPGPRIEIYTVRP